MPNSGVSCHDRPRVRGQVAPLCAAHLFALSPDLQAFQETADKSGPSLRKMLALTSKTRGRTRLSQLGCLAGCINSPTVQPQTSGGSSSEYARSSCELYSGRPEAKNRQELPDHAVRTGSGCCLWKHLPPSGCSACEVKVIMKTREAFSSVQCTSCPQSNITPWRTCLPT